MIHPHHAIQVRVNEIYDIDDPIVVEDRFDILFKDQPVTEIISTRDPLLKLGDGFVVSEGISRNEYNVTIDGVRILVYSDLGCETNPAKRAE